MSTHLGAGRRREGKGQKGAGARRNPDSVGTGESSICDIGIGLLAIGPSIFAEAKANYVGRPFFCAQLAGGDVAKLPTKKNQDTEQKFKVEIVCLCIFLCSSICQALSIHTERNTKRGLRAIRYFQASSGFYHGKRSKFALGVCACLLFHEHTSLQHELVHEKQFNTR